MVGTSISPPNAARTMDIGTRQYKPAPPRWKTECAPSARKMKRPPAGPPRPPASPSPASLMRVPSSTPAGMLTESARSRVTRPEPEQDGQGLSITWPRPWQLGQVRSRVKKPWAWRIRPWPPQVGQAFGLVPDLAPEPEQDSQVTEVGMRTCAVLPA